MKRRAFLQSLIGIGVMATLPEVVKAALPRPVSKASAMNEQTLKMFKDAQKALDDANIPATDRFVSRWNDGALEHWYIDKYGKVSARKAL